MKTYTKALAVFGLIALSTSIAVFVTSRAVSEVSGCGGVAGSAKSSCFVPPALYQMRFLSAKKQTRWHSFCKDLLNDAQSTSVQDPGAATGSQSRLTVSSSKISVTVPSSPINGTASSVGSSTGSGASARSSSSVASAGSRSFPAGPESPASSPSSRSSSSTSQSSSTGSGGIVGSSSSSSPSATANLLRGSCIVQDDNWHFSWSQPLYTSADSGPGYVKTNKGTSFASIQALRDVCTQAEFTALDLAFCAQNPGRFHRWWVATYMQTGDTVNGFDVSSFGNTLKTCADASSSSSSASTQSSSSSGAPTGSGGTL